MRGQRPAAEAAPDPDPHGEAPGPRVVDWDAEAPPAVVDWDAEDGAGYHVDWDAAAVRSPLVMDWDNLSVHPRPSEGMGAPPAREETRSAHPSELPAESGRPSEAQADLQSASESQALGHRPRKSREPAVVDWDDDQFRAPIVMDWDGVSTRDTYPLPGRNSIMALGIVDWDRDSIRKPVFMDWDKDAQKGPLVTDWDLITPVPDRSAGSRAAVGSDALQSSEVRSGRDLLRGKKWVVDEVLLQAAAKAAAAQRQRVGPRRSTIMRSNLVDWDQELEREAMAREDAEAKAREDEARARQAEEKAKAKAQIRARQLRPRADEVPKKIFGAGGSVWEAPATEEPEELGLLSRLGKKIGILQEHEEDQEPQKPQESSGMAHGSQGMEPQKPEESSEMALGSQGITERPVNVAVEIGQACELTAPPGVEAYVTVSLEAESKALLSKNTETAERSPDPVFEEMVELELSGPPFASELKLVVYGYMKFSFDRLLGTVNIPLESLPIGKEHSMLCDLEGGESQHGKLQIYVTLKPYEDKKEEEKEPSRPPSPEEEEEEKETTGDASEQPEPELPQHVVEASEAAEQARQRVEAAAADGVHHRLPQEPVRAKVRLVEGRRVYDPSNPAGGDAFCKVVLGSDVQRTKERAGVLRRNPIWKDDFSLEGEPGTGAIAFHFLDTHSEWVKNDFGFSKEVTTELFLGRLFIPIGPLPLGQEVDEWYRIQGGLAEHGQVRLKITLLSGHVVVDLPGFPPHVHPATSDDNQFMPSGPRSSGWLPMTVPAGIESMGWVPAGMAPERMFVEAILPASWAAQAKLCAEDELISIAGKDVSEYSEESLMELLQSRPLELIFYRHDWDADGAAEKKGAEGHTEKRGLGVEKKSDHGSVGEKDVDGSKGSFWKNIFRWKRAIRKPDGEVEVKDDDGEVEEKDPDNAADQKEAEREAEKRGVLRDPNKELQLQLEILEGKNLWAMSKGEVFVVAGLQSGGKPHVTNVQVGANPQWNESSILMVPQGEEEVILELSAWDLELSERDEHLGALNVPLDQLEVGEVADWWCVLQGGNAMPGAEVRLRLQLLEKREEDGDTLDSHGQLSAPRSDSLGPVHLLLEIEEATGLMKYGETNLPEDVDAFIVFDAGAAAKPYVTAPVSGLGSLEWRERALMEVTSGTTDVVVTVWDKALQVEDKPLGRLLVKLDELPIGRAVDEWYDLVDGVCSEARLRLRVTLVNTLPTQEPFLDLKDEHNYEGEDKKLAQQLLLNRVRSLYERATLKVDVLEGWDLVSRCNAYAMISLGNGKQMQKTGTAVRASNCPKWENETLVFDLPPAQEVLEVSVWDEDLFGQGDDLIGVIHVPTDDLLFGQVRDEWYDLTEGPIQTSKVRLRLSIQPRDEEPLEVEHHLHRITIELVEGSDLRDPQDPSGTEPYVVLSVGEDPYITKTVKGHENPEWNETATFEIHRDIHALQISVWDWDPWSKEDLLGVVRIPFGTLPVNQIIDEWYEIHDGLAAEGKVHVRIVLEGLGDEEPVAETQEDTPVSDPAHAALLLRVKVMEGTNMTEPTEPDGVEAYAMFSIDDQKAFFTSNIAKQSREPSWNETAEAWVPKDASRVEIQVWDSDYLRDEKLGVVRIPLKSLTLNQSTDNWYELAEGEAIGAKIHLCVTLEGEEWQAEELQDVDDSLAVATICAPPPPTRHLKVEIVDGADMAEPGGSCDPYVILSVEGGHQTYQTKMIKESLFPEWNEITTFVLPTEATALEINVMDSNYFSDQLVGKAFVVFETLPLGSDVEQWYSLGEGGGENARIRLRLKILEQDMVDMLDPFDLEKLRKEQEKTQERPQADLKIEILQGSNITEPSEPDGCDSYVIVSLGDGQSHTTHSEKQNPSPEWNETVTFDLQPEVEFLDLNVWDWDLLFPDELLGAARVPLEGLNFGEPIEEWYEISGGVAEQSPKILLRLTLVHKEQPTADLKIQILEGRNMTEPSEPDGCDAYVVVSLDDGQSYTTNSVKHNPSPEWNETVTFELKLESEKFLNLNVWDWDLVSADEHLGKARVPLEGLKFGESIEEWYEVSGGAARVPLDESSLDKPSEVVEEEDLPKVLLCLTLFKREPPRDLKIDILQGVKMTEPSERDGSDSYVVVSLADGQSYTTKSVKQNSDPEWDETVTFELQPGADETGMWSLPKILDLNVWDWDVFSADEHLGAAQVPLDGLQVGEPFELWYEISGGMAAKGARVQLRLTLMDKKGEIEEEPEDDADKQKRAKLKVAILEGSSMKVNCALYVMLSLGEGSNHYKTESQNSGISRKPKWNESTLLEIAPGTEALEVSLWDGNYLCIDDNMGKFSIPLLAFQDVSEFDEWYTFEGGTGYGAGGKVRLRLKLLDPRILLDLPEQRLRVDIVEGKDLTDNPEGSPECSAWLTLEVKGDDDPPYKTQRIQKDRCPKWDESTIFRIQSMLETTQLEVNVWSHFMLHLKSTKDFLGMTRIPLGSLKVGESVDEWYDIGGGKPAHAQIRLRLLVLEEDEHDLDVLEEEEDSKQEDVLEQDTRDSSENVASRKPSLETRTLSENFRHGQLLFEINNRRVPYIVVPRGLKDFSRLLLVLLFNWGLPSPAAVLRAVGGEKHLYSEWLDSCRDILCWAPKEGALPENPALESTHYSSGVRAQSVGRLPATEDILSDYFANFISKMETFAVDTCESAAATDSWLESDASTMGIAGLLGVGARCVLRSLQAKKFVWLGLYTHPIQRGRNESWNDRNIQKLWDAAVPVNQEVTAPLRIPLEETPQIPQSRTLPGESEEDWNAFRHRHQAFINPWITHLLLFYDSKDREGWYDYVGHNLPVVGMTCNDIESAGLWRKVLLVNHSGGLCDHWADALKQHDAQKHVNRLNWSGLFHEVIDYKQHQSTFQKLGGAWACDLIAKMEQNARTAAYMLDMKGQSETHTKRPNKFIKKMAAKHMKQHYLVEPPPPPELPQNLTRDQVVILDLATDAQANIRQAVYDSLCQKDMFQKIEEEFDAIDRKATSASTHVLDQEALAPSPNEIAMRKASLGRKRATMAPRCRFCGAEAASRLLGSDLDPSLAASPAEASFDLKGLTAGCNCHGVNQFYHLSCLQTDFIVRREANETTWSDFRCSICRQVFHGHALMEVAHISKGRLTARHGSHSREVARALHFLGVAHSQIGANQVAAQLFADSLNISEEQQRVTGVYTNDMAETLRCLAKFYRRPADTLKERQALERCLAIKEKLLGEGHMETCAVIIELAAAYARAGDTRREREVLSKVRALNLF